MPRGTERTLHERTLQAPPASTQKLGWTVTDAGNELLVREHGFPGQVIASIRVLSGERTRQAYDNANLIAAAPELLDALVRYVEPEQAVSAISVLGRNAQERLDKALLAIAKAEGSG